MSHISRRECISSLIGASAASLLSSVPTRAEEARQMVIDTHHHYYPPSYIMKRGKEIRSAAPAYTQVFDWKPSVSLAEMDAAGVTKAILSISSPGIWFGDAKDTRALARECNDYAAQAVKSHPGRFGFFGVLPLPDRSGSLAEAKYVLDQLDGDGIGLLTSYDGKYLGDPAFAPLFEELDRRAAVVYVHPTVDACCRNLVPQLPPAFIEFMFDTTRTIASLAFSGAFARYRNIRFIFSHGGGTVPMLAARMEMWARQQPSAILPDGLQGELTRHFYDTVSLTSPSAIAALRNFVPPSHLLFGTDFPFGPVGKQLEALSLFGLSDGDLALVKGGTAHRLLARPGHHHPS